MSKPLDYAVQLNAHGTVRFKATVAAHEAGIAGDYHNGVPYQPNNDEVRAALPFAYRKAFDRAMKWWQTESMSGRRMPLKCDLRTLRGKPMGTLFATPNWAAI